MSQTLTRRPTRRDAPTLWTPQFIAVSIAALAYFTADGVLIAAIPRYVAGPLGAGNIAVGVVMGSFSVSAFLLRPWVGRLGDRWGRRPLMLVGAAAFAASVLAYPAAPNAAALAMLRLVTGAGEAFFFVGAVTAFTDLAPAERRGEAMSLASLSLYVGIGVGPLLGELAIGHVGFPAPWLLAAAAAVGALGMAARVPETRPASPVPPPGESSTYRLVHPAGVLPGLVLLASILGMAGFLTFVPLYALDLGMSGSSLVLFVFSAVVVGIRSAGARLPDQLGPARATRVALLLSAVGLTTAGVWRAPAGLLAGAVVLGVGIALLTPAVFALAVGGVPARERGSVIGTVSAFLDLAFGLGPVMLGFVAASLGRPGTFLAGAVIAGGGLILVVATRLGRPVAVAA